MQPSLWARQFPSENRGQECQQLLVCKTWKHVSVRVKMQRQQKSHTVRHKISLKSKPRIGDSQLHTLTCYVDLDLQVPFSGHRKGRPLGNYSTFHSFGNYSRFAARVTVAKRSNFSWLLNITGGTQHRSLCPQGPELSVFLWGHPQSLSLPHSFNFLHGPITN